MRLILHRCPTCGADTDQPCRASKRKRSKKLSTEHATRDFSLIVDETEIDTAPRGLITLDEARAALAASKAP